tara:strand:+ start:441 stop:701 length:261 start_codon:yes stop_codon:yes gene_type:complete
MARESYDPIEDGELDCLVMWPEGTLGFQREQEVLRLLNKLCKEIGYGRIPQLALQMEALWRDSGKHGEFQDARDTHLDLISQTRRG